MEDNLTVTDAEGGMSKLLNSQFLLGCMFLCSCAMRMRTENDVDLTVDALFEG